MKWKYTFTRYMSELSDTLCAFEYGIRLDVESPDGTMIYFATGKHHGDTEHERIALTIAPDDLAEWLCNYYPGAVAKQIADALMLYCKGSVEELEEAVGVVFNEKVGYFGETPLGVEV